MNTVKKYLSLVKFSHTIFAMPFALIGFTLGVYDVRPTGMEIITKLLLVLGCMVTARSAAMAFNRYLDRQFDALNPRTAVREIPQGVISPVQALIFTAISCCVFMVCCAFINLICLYLSPVALFVILFYSYTKRFTPLCHLVLGLGLSLAPIGAYLAVTGVFSLIPILFSLAVICWVSGFDIIYALQDEEFDRTQGLKSIPAYLGKVNALRVSEGLHVISASMVLLAGYLSHAGSWYWAGVVVFCGMLIYQHRLVKPTDLSKVNIAFMTANGIASLVFGALTIMDIIWQQGHPLV